MTCLSVHLKTNDADGDGRQKDKVSGLILFDSHLIRRSAFTCCEMPCSPPVHRTREHWGYKITDRASDTQGTDEKYIQNFTVKRSILRPRCSWQDNIKTGF